MKFAKVFDIANGDQVLFWLTSNEGQQPEIRMITNVNGLVCRANTEFKNTDDSWDAAESTFDGLDQAAADKFHESMLDLTGQGGAHNAH